MLKIVVIARSFDALERKLLTKNCERARKVFGEISLAYVLGEREAYDANPYHEPGVSFYLVANPRLEKNAALSRAIGYQVLNVCNDDLVLFLDGDMLVTQEYLEQLRSTHSAAESFVVLCSRVDVQFPGGRLYRRRLSFHKDIRGRFVKMYGSMAIRGLPFEKHNVMTHDMEEQWFLRSLEATSVHCIVCEQVGILHFDRFTGARRKLRAFNSSRGVGFWQGVFRDASLVRAVSDALFILRQKKSIYELCKFFVSVFVSLPKFWFYKTPKQLCFYEITRSS